MQKTAESRRITRSSRESWQRWGTYMFNRSWGNVRESAPSEEEPWVAFPFEYARSRAYRWSEDAIGGFCDAHQNVCLAVAFWNERDPILKERYFGLGNEPGNHGEGIKDYFFLLDALPSYSYAKMLYKYPQEEYPYDRIYRENLRRGQEEPAFELIDAFNNTFQQNRYFDIFIEYAKADAEDILCRITAINRGNKAAPLHILPHLWFRNTWQQGGARPELHAEGKSSVHLHHTEIGERWWHVETPDVGYLKDLLFTENESNNVLLYDSPNQTPYVKDGIDYALVWGQADHVNPEQRGTKCAADCYAMVEPGALWVIRVRFQPQRSTTPFADFDAIFEQRQREADEFYAALQKPDLSAEERDIQRKAFASLNWNRKFYNFNVDQWMKEDSHEATPNEKQIASFEQWRHFDAHEILSIPDPWEYPWFALWDLDFQLVTLGLIDPEFAKDQVLLLLDDHYMRPDGAMPAFEGDFMTPHPPIHAWAAWHVYQQSQDRPFLHDAYVRLKRHHDWWLKSQSQGEQYLFGGGFLGMDNISVLNRSEDVPEGGWLAQADGTGWMALFTLNLLAIAVELGEDADAAAFLTHFIEIRKALIALWSDEDQFFYDLLYTPETGRMLLKVRSLVGLVPLTGALLLDPASLDSLPQLRARVDALRRDGIEFKAGVNGCYLLSALAPEKLSVLLKAIFDSAEFYSPYGMRSLSKAHEAKPVSYKIGDETFDLKYEPGEASKKLFGGNSNWRGPIWAPLNQLIVEALYIYYEYFGDDFCIPGAPPLNAAAHDLTRRMIRIFQRDDEGCRPFHGKNDYFQSDPHWRDYLWFYEHFHGETGEGLGASHQNGWTALIAWLIQTDGRGSYVPKPPPASAHKSQLKPP
jgi:hypothetical protein